MTTTVGSLSLNGRIRAMMFGVAYGDAIGATVEKLSAAEISERYGRVKQQLQGLLPATGKTSSSIDGLELIRRDRAARDESCIYQPAIEFIVQGEMESLTGNERLAYGEGQIMVTGIDAPCIINDIKVAADAPFLCVDLVLDLALVTEISVNMGTINLCNSHKGICVIPSTPEIADAFLRLIRLLHTPQHIEALGR